MGDDVADSGSAQVRQLQGQLNRFGAKAPVGFRFLPMPLVIDGVLSVDAAARAVAILQSRYLNALSAFPGETTTSLAKLKQVTSAAAEKDPLGYVVADLPSVTSLIQKYGDANGLPAAVPGTFTEMITSPSTVIVLGLAAATLYLGSR
jgi:hypothetical protein